MTFVFVIWAVWDIGGLAPQETQQDAGGPWDDLQFSRLLIIGDCFEVPLFVQIPQSRQRLRFLWEADGSSHPKISDKSTRHLELHTLP